MKKNKLLLLVAIIAFASCAKNPYPGFNKTDDGLYYQFHTSGDGVKPNPTDYALVHLMYSDEAGEIYLDNRGQSPLFLPISEPTYPGDIYDAIKMMSVGDSATFLINMREFFEVTTGSMLPPEINADGMLTFEIKLLDVKTQQQLIDAEKDQLEAFLLENNISTNPTESGLIYIENNTGRGPLATDGNTVKVHYRGSLLDGTVFDSSFERNEPFEFELGRGMVIKGWDEGIKLMRKGGKARLVIPSSLAYGSFDMGQIRPFSTLLFDVELVDIQ
jgi:FKBP-type peptidyl-prolyl cis-trans isomerase